MLLDKRGVSTSVPVRASAPYLLLLDGNLNLVHGLVTDYQNKNRAKLYQWQAIVVTTFLCSCTVIEPQLHLPDWKVICKKRWLHEVGDENKS